MRRTYNYIVTPTLPERLEPNSNTVMFKIQPGSETELIHATGNIAMQVQGVEGKGEVVIYRPNGRRDIFELRAGLAVVAIDQGDTYQYLHTGEWDRPFAVLDRCSPPFREGDEVSLEPSSAADGLQPGDYLLLWSQRQPKQARLAGGLRLAILEEHDTTASNVTRAGQSKFYGQPSHWHALAQRVGEDDIWPVNVQQSGGAYRINPHRLAPNAIIGTPPSFELQPDTLVFKGTINYS